VARPAGAGHNGGMHIVGVLLVAALGLAVPEARPEAQPPAVLVAFEQTGGFAGIERSLIVDRSGKVVADGFPVTTRRLSTTRLRALRDALVRARFATLRRTYGSDPPVADGYVYGISYGGRTIHIEEGAQLPTRLARPYSLLMRLVAH
jgi:hypothetical protein